MSSSDSINLARLATLAESAFNVGFDHIISCTLPSNWHPKGCGWQEQWKAPFAGFYASCDGVLLITESLRTRRRSGLEQLLESVYSNHLCLVLDEDRPAADQRQQGMRETCLGTTTKLAKFIQASASHNPLQSRHQPLVDRVRDKIITAGRNSSGAWPANIDGTGSPIISATCESLVALSHSYTPDIEDLIQKGAANLIETITHTSNKKWKLASLWALVESSSRLDAVNLRSLREQAHVIAPLIEDLDDDCVTDTFNNSLGHGDYYHFNARLLGAKALLKLFSMQKIGSEHLPLCAPVVRATAEGITNQGHFYTDDGSSLGPRFWEHYQAMSLLSEFCECLRDRPNIGGKTYMWIDPKHFEKKDFTLKSNLAVVLMPFRPTWSTDVYNALDEALASKGFTSWRSDLRFRDDKIVQSIWEEINRARLIIAECTQQNPNVFYELGIAHTIGKPVFICAQTRKDIPFDLAAIRSFTYGGATPTQLKSLQDNLIKFVDDLSTQ